MGPLTCKSGYGVKGKACVACKVTNCADCADNEAECKTCKVGFSADEKKKTCLKCADGCAACTSDCMRSCTKCVEKTKTAPSCGCAAKENGTPPPVNVMVKLKNQKIPKLHQQKHLK